MGVIIFLVLIGLGACLIGSLASKTNSKFIEKQENIINSWQDEWFNNLQIACIEKGIAAPSRSILNKEERWVAYNGGQTHAPGYLWEDGKHIVFCPDALNQCGRPMADNLLIIPFNDIVFYTKDGNVSYTNKIINEGKNVSVSGAIVGGLIAGDAGAIIGAGKDANKIKNVTVAHDDIHTFIYYNAGNDCVKIADVKGEKFYTYILQLLPNKEYNYVNNLNADTTEQESDSVKEGLKRLKDLYDSDLIDEAEYKAKKEQLLNQL